MRLRSLLSRPPPGLSVAVCVEARNGAEPSFRPAAQLRACRNRFVPQRGALALRCTFQLLWSLVQCVTPGDFDVSLAAGALDWF